MEVGVFIPIGNNGWLISTTSPQYKPTWDLNREVVQRAERYGLDFAMSMIKLRGFGGPSEYWDHSLESFTLMAGLAAVTERINLIATVAVLTMPPAFTARMAVTIDSISRGRFGVNIVSGWQRAEYDQMGIWPGAEHYAQRYEYCAEYVHVMRELWATGRSDFKGKFFQMTDCRLSPQPQVRIPIVCAAQSDTGSRFAAEHGDYNFCAGSGLNEPRSIEPSVARLVAENRRTGKDCGALVLTLVVADETDEAALAKWEHYKAGADIEALAWREAQVSDDPTRDYFALRNRFIRTGEARSPTSLGVLCGSYATVARLLDEMADVPGVKGVMLACDDFLVGMDQFGRHIQPLMKSRRHVAGAAA